MTIKSKRLVKSIGIVLGFITMMVLIVTVQPRFIFYIAGVAIGAIFLFILTLLIYRVIEDHDRRKTEAEGTIAINDEGHLVKYD